MDIILKSNRQICPICGRDKTCFWCGGLGEVVEGGRLEATIFCGHITALGTTVKCPYCHGLRVDLDHECSFPSTENE